MGKSGAENGDVIMAAGGIVTRDTSRGREYAIIHRPRHGDWTLPKGKLDPKERWQDAALREIEEETGFEVELGEFAGSCSYMTRNAPKIVLFWHMPLVGEPRFQPDDPDEVDQLVWLPLEKALERLSYDRERRVLFDAVTTPMLASPAGIAKARALAQAHVDLPLGVIGPPAQGSKLLRWLLRNVSRH